MPSQASSTPDEFFHALRSSWITVPPSIQDSFLRQTEEFMKIEDRLRNDQALARYDLEMYPELASLLGVQEGDMKGFSPRDELHFCNLQIQLMENVFYAVRLSEYHAHPLNRGWISLFRRWTAVSTLRLLWPGLRGTYSKAFVEFAEYNLNLTTRISPTTWSKPLTPWPNWTSRLFLELKQEWPDDKYRKYDSDFLEHPLSVVTVSSSDVAVVPPATRSATTNQEAWGIALSTRDKAEEAIRLMVWVRGAHRRCGLGQELLNKLLETSEVQQSRKLIVELPPFPPEKPGYQEEMAGWLRFYGRKGFVRDSRKDKYLYLTLEVGHHKGGRT